MSWLSADERNETFHDPTSAPNRVSEARQAGKGQRRRDDDEPSCRTIHQMDTTRVDVWLWAVRLYKSRSAATAACRGGHVRVNRAAAKASTPVKVGDRVEAFVERKRVLEVVTIINKRVGAAVAATCLTDHSPPVPVVKRLPRVAVREPGSGRPTKRERRELDRFRGA
jgi:ribosome-associated heat shock protein Hsp15